MSEIYIFSQDDKLLTVITESTGLISALFRDEVNSVASEPFTFTVEADIERAKYVKEENQVVFRDKEGDLRLYVIKELDDLDNADGPQTMAICEPAFMELKEHIVVDRRFVDKEAQEALNAALQGTRWTGKVEVTLGKATTNFYYISSVDAVWKILDVWGGEFKDIVTFDGNKITSRQIRIKQRLGADKGARFEIDHNIEEIQRTILSYPVTALYGRGASLEIEDEDGNHTGGYTRLIDFADVEWKKSKGDPVDKPLGQKWVGDPDALLKYGRKHNNQLLHRFGVWENGDYDDPAKLLQATWEALQEAKEPEVNYRLAIYLFDKDVNLGDTARAIDRQFARPIEIQSRAIAIEYDLLDIEGTAVVEMGQFLSVYENNLGRELDDLKNEIRDNRGKWESDGGPITNDRFPDIKPGVPMNIEVYGGFRVIQLYWEYDSEVYISHYEVYGSQVKDFVPDSQHLLYRGRVSGFAHEVESDQRWYYRIRAVNHHGRPSDWSKEVTAATVRIISDDILFGSIIADHLSDNLDIAEKLAQNTIDRINQGPMEAIQYTQEEIEETEKRLLNQLNTEIGDVNASINGLNTIADNLKTRADETDALLSQYGDKFTSIETEIDDIEGRMSATITSVERIDNTVSSHTAQLTAHADLIAGKVDDLTYQRDKDGLIENIEANTTEINVLSKGLELRVTKEEFDALGIGGRNYLLNSDFSSGQLHPFSITSSAIWNIQNVATQYRHAVSKNGKELRIDFTESTDPIFLNQDIENAPFLSGKKLMFSFYYATSMTFEGSFRAYIRVITKSGETKYINSSKTFTRGQRNELIRAFNTADLSDEDIEELRVVINFSDVISGIVWLQGLQLEEGTMMSSWSKAEEEIEAEIGEVRDRVSTTETTLTVHAGEIKARAKLSDVYTRNVVDDKLGNKIDTKVYNEKIGELTTSIDGISGRVSNTESSINSLNGEIDTALSQIAEVNIKADGISQRVSEISSDFDGLDSRVSSAETSITSLSERIELKASQTEVNKLTNRMTAAESAINLMPDEIDLRVSEGIGGIQIGSRNYLLNSDFSSGDLKPFTISSAADWRIQDVATDFRPAISGSSKELRLDFSQVVESVFLNQDLDNASFLSGKKLMFSFYYATSIAFKGSFRAYIRIITKSGETKYINSFKEFYGGKGNELLRGFNVADLTNEDVEELRIVFNFSDVTDGVIWLQGLKLEDGTKMTDWSPAIEDQVSTSRIVASINLSKEGVRIDGKQIHLTGQTLIEDGIIGNAAIANASISRAKLGTAVVGTAQIDDLAVTGAKIANATIDNAKIADATITSAKIKEISADLITTGKLKAQFIGAGEITGVTIRTSGRNDNYLHLQNQMLRLWNNSLEKMRLGFYWSDLYSEYNPYIRIGAGFGSNNDLDQMTIRKMPERARLEYKRPDGQEVFLTFRGDTDVPQISLTHPLAVDNLWRDTTNFGKHNKTKVQAYSTSTRWAHTNNSFIRQLDGGQVDFVMNGVEVHKFYTKGTKTGGSIEIDGTRYGMSPVDSPQVLLEYIEFDIELSPFGTKITIDEKFLKAINYKFAIFPNNGKVTKKGHNYFILEGRGVADCRIVGKRIDHEDAFWSEMNVVVDEEELENVV